MLLLKKIRTGFAHIPICVRWLLVVNTIIFTLVVILGWLALGSAVLLSIPANLLLNSGGYDLPLVVDDWQFWRIISYAFLHGNILHLVFNMLALWQVGSSLEREIGWRRFLGVYFFSTIIAILFSSIASPETITIGASGALFGVIGFSISFYHRIGSQKALIRRNLMVQWAVYAIMFGVIMNADNAAHIGGAIAGCFAGIFTPASRDGLLSQKMAFPGQGYILISIIGSCVLMQLYSWSQTAIIFFSF